MDFIDLMNLRPHAPTEKFLAAATDAAQTNTGVSRNSAAGGVSASVDPFWSRPDTTQLLTALQSRWNQSYPYQLLILEKTGPDDASGTNYRAKSQFTLPIPPQALSISTPFAINTSVTMGGILEEHNGAPLRMITLQGTTGVAPLRGSVEKPGILETQLSTVFAGTTKALNKFGGLTPTPTNLLGSDFNMDSTGFYQFTLLKGFLESYAALKKNGKTNYRLAFAVWKEQEVYLVTPVSFDVPRSAASPMEYPFSIVMKAWKRIRLDAFAAGTGSYKTPPGLGRNPGVLAALLGKLDDGRAKLSAVNDLLAGFRADVQSIVFTPVRQTILAIKDLAGVATTLVDFPLDIIRDTKESILELPNLLNAKNPLIEAAGVYGNRGQLERAWDDLIALANDSGKSNTGSGRDPSNLQSQYLSVSSSQNRYNAHPAHKLFDDPQANFPFFSSFKLSDLNLRPDTRTKIEAERTKVRLMQRQDYEKIRDQIDTFAADFSDFVGAGSATYTKTYGLPVRTVNRTPTDQEWDIIYTLNEMVQQFDTLCVNTDINQNQVSSLDYVAGLAHRSGIAFTVPQSKFAVNFPYGYTLELLSNQYLGTPDRWHEIATLNGLRAPYVDESGFTLPLLTNGHDNQVVVADGTNLYVGQLVWLSANNIRRESRRVQSVDLIADSYVIGLDGAPDLSKFSLAATPILQAFLPDTVNSQQQIFVPSDSEPGEIDNKVKQIPGVDYYDPIIRASGVDLLLTYDNDLVITPDGDGRYAVGLTNIVQQARLAIGTQRGALLDHPEYGIGIKPGMSNADLDAKSLASDLKNMFSDSPDIKVQSASVVKSANSMFINLSVGVVGTNQFVPLSVELKR